MSCRVGWGVSMTQTMVSHAIFWHQHVDSYIRFEVLVVVYMSVLVFWDVMPCGAVGRYQRFRGMQCHHVVSQPARPQSTCCHLNQWLLRELSFDLEVHSYRLWLHNKHHLMLNIEYFQFCIYVHCSLIWIDVSSWLFSISISAQVPSLCCYSFYE
jgi:hypothetical protein